MEIDANPRPGNYGGGTYKALPNLRLDYVRVVLPDRPDVWMRLRRFLGTWEDRGFGWRGWYDKSARTLDGGLVAWCSERSRADVEGIMVDLPGRALGCLGASLRHFCVWAASVGKFTRIDVAIDDRSGLITRERLDECEDTGAIVSRWRRVGRVEARMSGQLRGWTRYYGSRESDAMVRIYDKAAERGEAGPWVRVELETKGELADALMRSVLVAGPEVALGQLNQRIRFCEAEADSNHRRWRAAWWWKEFLGRLEAGGSLVASETARESLEGLRRWLERQVAPSLALYLAAEGGDVGALEGLVEAGRGRWGPRHLGLLRGVG